MPRAFSTILCSFAAVLLSALPGEASAFCGFYVGGAEASLFNNATQVALMREGTRTVTAMQNDYQGPPEDFAMVVPVPVVLQKEQVKTLSPELFAKLDRFTAPRLVEYHEQDPCQAEDGYGYSFEDDPLDAGGFGPSDATIRVRPAPVRVLNRFAVGEYEIVILGADDSASLDTWLRQNGYKIPAGAEPYLRPYVLAGDKFFVAKVDSKKVTFQNGKARLSPLRFHHDSPVFRLPVRLGLINARGPQDLIVYTIGAKQRYEVANRENVAAPTNQVLKAEAKSHFGSLYRGIFDRIQEAHPGAVVTEHSWSAFSCDPCPTDPLAAEDLEALGAEVMPKKPPAPDDDGIAGIMGQPDWVITRLHTRQERRTATDDLIFRQAPPLVGGVGVPSAQGSLERKPSVADANTFQARYVQLHRWKGPVACASPGFGRWGYSHQAMDAATDPSNAPVSNSPLEGFFQDQAPELIRLGGATPESAGPLPLRSSGGCAGCEVRPSPQAVGELSALVVIALAGLARRTRCFPLRQGARVANRRT